jgi:LemA protein
LVASAADGAEAAERLGDGSNVELGMMNAEVNGEWPIFVACGKGECLMGMHMTTEKFAMARLAGRVALVFALGVALSGCSYNKFTSQEEAVKQSWSEVQNQLQRRNDLIPNLVETVKGYAKQERDIFIAIADSRSKLLNAKTTEEQVEAANAQTGALGRLLAISENYPQLKSDQNFQRLMDELAGTESRIATARRRYNETAQQYNTLRRSFPSNVTGKVFGFKEYPYFEAPPDAQKLPKVDFSK